MDRTIAEVPEAPYIVAVQFTFSPSLPLELFPSVDEGEVRGGRNRRKPNGLKL